MKLSLKTKMIIWIWGSTALMLTLILSTFFNYLIHEVLDDLRTEGELYAKYYERFIEERFSYSQAVAEMSAAYIEGNPEAQDEAAIINYLSRMLQQNVHIYGAAIALEPTAAEGREKYLAPYVYRRNKKNYYVQLGAQQDYNYPDSEWFSVPRREGKPRWSEPYFDLGGGDTLMITYSVPFYRKGTFSGIATVDVSLDELANEVSKNKLGKTGYCFLITQKGNFLSFPDKKQLLTGNLFELNPELAQQMTSGKKSDLIETREPYRNAEAWVLYRSLPITGFYIGFVYPKSEALEYIKQLAHQALFYGFAGLILQLLVVFLIAGSITRPLLRLSEGAARVARGDLEYRIPLDSRTREIEVLGSSFNGMAENLRKYIDEIKSATAEKERISSELGLARDIQLSVCPRTFPAFPDKKNIDLFARMDPAREVGGDFYDFFLLDDNHLGLVVGDTSGKGIPAALFTMMCQAYIRAVALRGLTPAECLSYTNTMLYKQNEHLLFVTVFYGVLDLQTGEMVYANGGHNPPFILDENGTVTRLTPSGNPALGIMEEVKYKNVTVNTGNWMFLYSDGVTEAQSKNQELYTEARLVPLLNEVKGEVTEKIIERVYTELSYFADGAPQADDITMVAVKVRKEPE